MTRSGSPAWGAEPPIPLAEGGERPGWDSVQQRLRDRGLRWTPQRRALVDVLARTDGHVTGSELVERCREADPATIPSTVYRTLDVLEDLGVISHSHAADGREEFHVLPAEEHGHLYCDRCGSRWEIDADEAAALADALRARRGFELNLSHLTVVGRCAGCAASQDAGERAPRAAAARQSGTATQSQATPSR